MIRTIKTGLAAVVLSAVAFSAQASTTSYEMVVVNVEGAALKKGMVIDGNRALTLREGSKVTLVSADGSFVTLQGPVTTTPSKHSGGQASAGSDSKVVEIIGALLSDEQRSTKALGVVRSAGAGSFAAPPNEWAVNVEQSGARCIGGDVAVLWRSDTTRETKLSIRQAGSARSAKAVWPQGQEFFTVSRKMFQNGQKYQVALDDRTVEIKVNVMPQDLKGPAEQAAWMARNDCRSQALTMVERIR